MNLIRLIDIILKKEENLDMNILTYHVRPTSSKAGVIEMISDCDTIYGIKQDMDYSVLNYIMDHNKEDSVKDIRERFMKSCAAYCVIT